MKRPYLSSTMAKNQPERRVQSLGELSTLSKGCTAKREVTSLCTTRLVLVRHGETRANRACHYIDACIVVRIELAKALSISLNTFPTCEDVYSPLLFYLLHRIPLLQHALCLCSPLASSSLANFSALRV